MYAAIALLFFFSGASALVYEVVWTRMLTNVFGGSAFAIATVLAAYMGGLALGSAFFGRWIDRRGQPLAVYGLLEAGIGACALALPFLFPLLDPLYAGLYRSMGAGSPVLAASRFAVCFLLLLVPTTLMGGTLPVLGKLLLHEEGSFGRRAGLLYGVNTLGAVLGVAAGGFVLLPALGLAGTTRLAVLVNLAVAVVALRLAPRFTARAEVPSADRVMTVGNPALRRAAVAVYAASGFAALMLEVAWTKTLSMVLGTTTYAFTSMLTTFLLGLALGSCLMSRLADRRRPECMLIFVQLGLALAALATVPVMGRLPQLFVDGFPALSHSWIALETYRILLAALAMLLPAVLMGATFPLVARLGWNGEASGRHLGVLLAGNTMGAILGSLTAGFLLVSWLGRQNTVLVAAFVNAGAALALLAVVGWRSIPVRLRVATAFGIALLPVAVLAARAPWDHRVMASGAYLYADLYARYPTIGAALGDAHLLFYEETPEGTVSVWRREYKTWLRNNGKTDASSHGDMITQKLLAHVPALYRLPDLHRGLVIGLGSGVTPGALLAYDVDFVETVELMPAMERAARYFTAQNRGCLDDPRHRLLVADGRNHLQLTGETYDVIVSEPSNPWIAGVGSLFTREFFTLAHRRLAPGGVLCQWVQTYQFSREDLKTVLATFADVFPHVHLWHGMGQDLLVVGSDRPLVFQGERLAEALAGEPGRDLAALEALPLSQLLAFFVTDREGLDAYLDGWTPRITDDNLALEYSVPRHMFDPLSGLTVLEFESYRRSPLALLGAEGDSAFAEAWAAADAAHRLAALARAAGPGAGSSSEGGNVLAAALRVCPEERSARELAAEWLLDRSRQELEAWKPEEARNALGEALNVGLHHQKAEASFRLGVIAAARGEMDAARSAWTDALQREPGYISAHHRLGVLECARGDLEGGRRHLLQAADLGPDHREAWLELSHLYLRAEQWEAAKAALAQVHRLDPGNPAARMNEGAVWLSTGENARAARRFRDILAREPWRAEAAFDLALAMEREGRFRDAALAWEHYLRLRPRDAAAMNSLAWLLASHLDRPADAERWARTALELGGESADRLDTLAEALHRQGKRLHAFRAMELAVSLEDTDYYRDRLRRMTPELP